MTLNNPRWRAGTYYFHVESDGKTTECHAVLPLPSCGAPPAVQCTGAMFFTIQETGCASTQQGFPEVYFSQQPKTVGIRVSRGDVDLLSATLEPTYVTSAQTCPNTCGYATAELDVDR
ncbi:MAG: hypothetical protein R3B89_07980 [Polyangiaceae bacterium]